MKHKRFLHGLAYVLVILLFFLLQEAPDILPTVCNARPVLLIPVAVTIALFESQTAATAYGILCGLLIDLGSDSGVLGMHAMILAVVCFTLSYLAHDLLQTNVMTAFVTCCIVVGITVVLQWLFGYVAAGYADPGYALAQHYLPRFVYTVVLTFPIYALNRALARQL